MKTTLYTVVVLVLSQYLLACSGPMVNAEKHQRTRVNESHSVFIEGGVLKVFSDGEENILYVYVRPGMLDHWVNAGGGGGGQANPWEHASAAYWVLADGSGWYSKHAPRNGFDYLFDSRDMTLTMETGTYAVRRGQLVVISLDENWLPDKVESGLGSLNVFDVPAEERRRLISTVRKHYAGS